MRTALSSLRLRLLLLAFLVAIPMFGLVIYNASVERRADAERAQASALRLAQIVAREHQALFQETREIMIAQSRVPAIRDPDSPECSNYLAGLHSEFPRYGNLAIARLDGEVVCWAVPSPSGVNVADREYFQQALETGGFVVGDYQVGRVNGIPIVMSAYPIPGIHRQPQGVLIASLDLGYLNRIAQDQSLPAGTMVTMVDEQGTVLARYPGTGDLVGQSLPELPVLAAVRARVQSGMVEYVGGDGIPRLYAYQSFAGDSRDKLVYVTIGLVRQAAFADADGHLQRNLIQLALVSLFALTAAWGLSDVFVLRPIRALVQATQRLAAGDVQARTGLAADSGELGELARAFDRMAGALEQRQAMHQRTEGQLAQSVSELRTVFRALPDLYFRLAADGTIQDCVAGQAQDLYASPEQFLGRRMQQVLPPAVGEQFQAALDRCREKREVVMLEYALEVPSGVKAFEARVCPVSTECVVVVARDITERNRMRAAEREQLEFVQSLQDTTAALNGTLNVDQVLDRIMDHIGHVAPFDTASILLVEGAIAHLARQRGFAERGLAEWAAGFRFAIDAKGDLWRQMENGHPYVVGDTRRHPDWLWVPESDWIRSHIGAPVQIKDRTVAILCLDSETPDFYTAHQATRLQSLADQAAIALENAQLHQETGRRAGQLELLYQSGLALTSNREARAQLEFLFQSACRALNADAVEFFRYAAAARDLVLEFGVGEGVELPDRMRFALGDERGLVGRVAQTRQPLNLPDLTADARWLPGAADFQSALWVPVLHEDELCGVLTALSRRKAAFDPGDERMLVLFANETAIALENARLFQELQSALAMSTRFYQLSGQILGATTLDETARLVMQTVFEGFGADGVSIRLCDAQGHIQYQAGLGLPQAVYEEGQPRPDGITFEAFRTGAILVTNDPARIHPRLRAAGIQSNVAVPLRGETGTLGVLFLDFSNSQQLPERQAELLALFANQAALALERVRLLDETHQRIAELEAVNRISTALRAAQSLDEMLPIFLDEILAVLGADAGSILLYDPVHRHLHPTVARGWFATLGNDPVDLNGIAGHVIATGESFTTADLRSNVVTSAAQRDGVPAAAAGACIPIRSAQGAIGVFFVSVRLPRTLVPADVHLLVTLAEIAGNAVHRVRLFAQTEQRLQRLGALREIDQAVTASLDLRLALNVIVDQTMSQLGVDAVSLLRLDPATQYLYCAAVRGFRNPVNRRTQLSLSQSYAGRAVLERRLVSIPEIPAGADPQNARLTLNEGFRTYYGVPLIAKGKVKGVLEVFHRAHLEPDPEWLDFLNTLGGQAAIAIDNGELFDSLQRSNADLALAYDTTLEGWSHALDLRDRDTEGHTERVAGMTVRLARAMGMTSEQLVHIRHGALLHDIGKMGIPDRILLKQGPLTDDEMQVMRQHPVYAYRFLNPIAYLRPALDIPHAHHERWDGTGYPRGLQGDQIPIAARLFAVVDVWDALRSDRPYRSAWSDPQVHEYIRTHSGTQFDPQVVRVFMELIDTPQPD